jgi:glucose-6-phosphate 1-epimerase
MAGHPSELPRLLVHTPLGRGEVYLHGAQITQWTPTGQQPVIWLSRASAYEPGKAIRGGVPICFPWFGPGRGGRMTPQHGFARLAEWSLVSAMDLDGVVTLTFRLTEADVTDLPGAHAWGHPFELTYVVTFGAELTVALTVRNTGAEEWSYEEALHAYLAVDDVREISVEGVSGAGYIDKLAGGGRGRPLQAGPVTLSAETDRVYESADAVTLIDRTRAREVRVAKYGSSNTVVWNPWQTKAAAMSDLGDEEWSQLVCVETANVLDFAVSLRPGAAHALAARYSVEFTG